MLALILSTSTSKASRQIHTLVLDKRTMVLKGMCWNLLSIAFSVQVTRLFRCMCVCHHEMASFGQCFWLLEPLSQVSWNGSFICKIRDPSTHEHVLRFAVCGISHPEGFISFISYITWNQYEASWDVISLCLTMWPVYCSETMLFWKLSMGVFWAHLFVYTFIVTFDRQPPFLAFCCSSLP